jgi:uncharacterized protein YndB with AHSA1/START domain
MSRIRNRITIRRPIEDVFAVLTDVEQTGTWFPGDVEEHWTSPPPRGIGSTRHAVVRMGGRTTENDAVVTEYDPPHRAAMAGTSPNAPFVATLVFMRDGEATQVEVTTDLVFRGGARLAGPFFAAWYRRAWGRGLETLRQRMESGDL